MSAVPMWTVSCKWELPSQFHSHLLYIDVKSRVSESGIVQVFPMLPHLIQMPNHEKISVFYKREVSLTNVRVWWWMSTILDEIQIQKPLSLSEPTNGFMSANTGRMSGPPWYLMVTCHVLQTLYGSSLSECQALLVCVTNKQTHLAHKMENHDNCHRLEIDNKRVTKSRNS